MPHIRYFAAPPTETCIHRLLPGKYCVAICYRAAGVDPVAKSARAACETNGIQPVFTAAGGGSSAGRGAPPSLAGCTAPGAATKSSQSTWSTTKTASHGPGTNLQVVCMVAKLQYMVGTRLAGPVSALPRRLHAALHGDALLARAQLGANARERLLRSPCARPPARWRL